MKALTKYFEGDLERIYTTDLTGSEFLELFVGDTLIEKAGNLTNLVQDYLNYFVDEAIGGVLENPHKDFAEDLTRTEFTFLTFSLFNYIVIISIDEEIAEFDKLIAWVTDIIEGKVTEAFVERANFVELCNFFYSEPLSVRNKFMTYLTYIIVEIVNKGE